MFRYNVKDSLLVAGGLANVACVLGTFAFFNEMPGWLIAILWVVQAWFYCWNLQCCSHNFIHNPFFRWKPLNNVFAVLETIAIGVPHMIYHHYHMNHHFGDNDAKGPDGTTKDWSSIYRHSPHEGPENFFSYVLLGFFRAELTPVIKVIARHRHVGQLIVETIVLGSMWLTMLWLDWRCFVFFYLTSYYAGWVLSYAEGYFEHVGCQPGNPYANSVSSYHFLYNLLWFNNGFHQEHHWDPKRHWTEMRNLHDEIKPKLLANGTRMLKGPHMTLFFEEWLRKGERPGHPNLTEDAESRGETDPAMGRDEDMRKSA